MPSGSSRKRRFRDHLPVSPPPPPSICSIIKHSPEYKDFLSDGTITLYVGPDGKKMEMHKKLLASISPELNKHVNNDMREGIEGIIRLPDEGKEAVTLFIEWAYTGDYTHKGDTPSGIPGLTQDPWPGLHNHLQLWAFSDKFNVSTLKQLAELRFRTDISRIVPNSERDAAGLVMVIGYAYENLPSSDPILKFLARYAAWKLELLRRTTSFNDLILTQPDFLTEFLLHLKGPRAKPIATEPQEGLTDDDDNFRPRYFYVSDEYELSI
ncbi:hypothetical protein B9Z19DRAFT_1049678 [Tuber borchii]|uniref:BTB domain-containing protein n=1 Tax=Tuber borchii TaxID=42251 RepID=A0A2T6ZQK4_TUBBO|nr:hypothetical protein B9Z19DRAFT_1049678 [Tuber borchii]